MKDREKEIKYLIYLKSELIRQTKKDIKKLNVELEDLRGQKRLTKNKQKGDRNGYNGKNNGSN